MMGYIDKESLTNADHNPNVLLKWLQQPAEEVISDGNI